MNLGFFFLIYQYTPSIGLGNGWSKYQFFVFIATMQIINSLVQAFFIPNTEEFSELVRTGSLDFALLKPIDTQFLVSLAKMEWSELANFVFASGVLGYSLVHLESVPSLIEIVLYPGATHDFDDPGQRRQSLAANSAALQDAMIKAVAAVDGLKD